MVNRWEAGNMTCGKYWDYSEFSLVVCVRDREIEGAILSCDFRIVLLWITFHEENKLCKSDEAFTLNSTMIII